MFVFIISFMVFFNSMINSIFNVFAFIVGLMLILASFYYLASGIIMGAFGIFLGSIVIVLSFINK